MASISPIYARVLSRHLIAAGVPAEEVFAGTGIDGAQLYQSDVLELAIFRRILENAEAIGSNPPVGFLIGSYHNTWVFGPLGAAMGAAPTVRASLQLLETYTRLHTDYIGFETESGPHGLQLKLRYHGISGSSLRHHVESSLCFLERFLEDMLGRPVTGAHYRVSYAPPSYAADYARYLRGTVSFGESEIAMEVPLAGLDEDSPYFHAELWQSSQQQLSVRLREAVAAGYGRYSEHVYALLRSHQLPLPTLGQIAAMLHVSERTLNRRLQAEGSSFREFRGRAIDRWAEQFLLQTETSIEAIAATLGYQDAANFRRAFRKRAGMTPGQYRQRHGQ